MRFSVPVLRPATTFCRWRTYVPLRSAIPRSRQCSRSSTQEDREIVEGALAKAEKTEAELRYLADHDSLTGPAQPAPLPRRARPLRLLHRPLRRSGRGDDHRHRRPQGGQRQARPPARRQPDPPASPTILRERVRTTDIVARLSGDEFAVLMPQTDTDGRAAARRGPAGAGRRGLPGAGSELGTATISVGITMFGGERDVGAEAVLVAADQAMYRAKERGATGSPSSTAPRTAARPAAQPDDQRQDPRRPDPGPAQPRHAADPQPRLRRASSATSCCCG